MEHVQDAKYIKLSIAQFLYCTTLQKEIRNERSIDNTFLQEIPILYRE